MYDSFVRAAVMGNSLTSRL